MLPSLADDIGIPARSASWPSSAFALTTGCSLLFFGQLSDKYGGLAVFVGGLAWHLIWAIVAAFSHSEIMIDVCRALQGFGPAAFLSAGIMLLGSTYRPGCRKNLIFSISGASAPVGFFLGILVSGISGQLLSWRWYFWIGIILLFLAFIAGWACVPRAIRRKPPHPEIEIDWLCAVLLAGSLILIFFAINDCGHAVDGWRAQWRYGVESAQ